MNGDSSLEVGILGTKEDTLISSVTNSTKPFSTAGETLIISNWSAISLAIMESIWQINHMTPRKWSKEGRDSFS